MFEGSKFRSILLRRRCSFLGGDCFISCVGLYYVSEGAGLGYRMCGVVRYGIRVGEKGGGGI